MGPCGGLTPRRAPHQDGQSALLSEAPRPQSGPSPLPGPPRAVARALWPPPGGKGEGELGAAPHGRGQGPGARGLRGSGMNVRRLPPRQISRISSISTASLGPRRAPLPPSHPPPPAPPGPPVLLPPATSTPPPPHGSRSGAFPARPSRGPLLKRSSSPPQPLAHGCASRARAPGGCPAPVSPVRGWPARLSTGELSTGPVATSCCFFAPVPKRCNGLAVSTFRTSHFTV